MNEIEQITQISNRLFPEHRLLCFSDGYYCLIPKREDDLESIIFNRRDSKWEVRLNLNDYRFRYDSQGWHLVYEELKCDISLCCDTANAVEVLVASLRELELPITC